MKRPHTGRFTSRPPRRPRPPPPPATPARLELHRGQRLVPSALRRQPRPEQGHGRPLERERAGGRQRPRSRHPRRPPQPRHGHVREVRTPLGLVPAATRRARPRARPVPGPRRPRGPPARPQAPAAGAAAARSAPPRAAARRRCRPPARRHPRSGRSAPPRASPGSRASRADPPRARAAPRRSRRSRRRPPSATRPTPPRPAGKARARRTAAPARRSRRGRRLAAEQPPQQVHRHRGRAVADVRAVARQPVARVIRSPSRELTEKHTIPTGFSSVPPPGPAMPVIPIPRSAPKRAEAPSASASATSVETAPKRSISSASTPTCCDLGLVRVGHDRHRGSTPRSRPRSVSRADSSPPVHDSATATVRPASSPITCSSTVEPSRENSVSLWRSAMNATSAS